MQAVTVIARNYLAHARVLAASYARHHPNRLKVFVLDVSEPMPREPFDLLRPEDVFSAEEYQALVDRYSVLELATAVKPRVLLKVLLSTGEATLYIDPDIQVFAPLDALGEAAAQHGLVLTPHNLDPLPKDGLRPNDRDILLAGSYNLGFLAVGPKGRTALEWWWSRLERECLARPQDGMWVDQRWMDLAPGYFDHVVWKDPGCNVAYWNAHERGLARDGGKWTARGQPLCFFHFSGFDPHAPGRLSKHNQPNARVDATEPLLAALCEEYARAMLASGYDAARKLPFGRARSGSRRLVPGIFIHGYFRSEHGVGEAGRQVARAVAASGLPHASRTDTQSPHRQRHPWSEPEADSNPYDVLVVCANADQFPARLDALGADAEGRRYTIGVWFWETPTFPSAWHGRFQHVDELWVASPATRDALAPVSPVPVHLLPLPVQPPKPADLSRHDLGLPKDAFIVLYNYDFHSVARRKNPEGAIAAYRRAFGPNDGARLVLKSINGDKHPDELARIRALAKDRPDIELRDGFVDTATRDALLAACDVYLSLHRAEGFGLTMAEAMALGKPVVATASGGNMAYMDSTNAKLVPFRLVPVGAGCDPYLPTDLWAEPDVDAAAVHLRALRADPGQARLLGQQAMASLSHRLGATSGARFVRERYEAAQAHLQAGRPVASEQRRTAMQAPANPAFPPEAMEAMYYVAQRRWLYRPAVAILGLAGRMIRRRARRKVKS